MKPGGNVAIDGPAAAGKGTVAKLAAARLGLNYVDTGAMYRAAALLARRLGLSLGEELAIIDAVKSMEVGFETEPHDEDGLVTRVFMDGEEITEAIRSPEITELSSPIAAIPGVRRALQAKQRELALLAGGVVMEGRDIGSVVLPDAELKIFLTASVQERAKRRFLELIEKGMKIDLAAVEADIRERDERDSTRDDSPLKQAAEAVVVDTDDKSISEVVDEIVEHYHRRVGDPLL